MAGGVGLAGRGTGLAGEHGVASGEGLDGWWETA